MKEYKQITFELDEVPSGKGHDDQLITDELGLQVQKRWQVHTFTSVPHGLVILLEREIQK
jgi:hypothetical protein